MPILAGWLADRSSDLRRQYVVRERSSHRQQCLDDGRRRCALIVATTDEVGEQRRHVRNGRAQNGRAHPRIVPIPTREQCERFAGSAVVHASQGNPELKSDVCLVVISKANEGIGDER